MTKHKPTPYTPSKRIGADADNTNNAEVERLRDEITVLKAQLAAKSIHEQWCPHYNKTAGQPIGPDSSRPQMHASSFEGWVPTVLVDSPLPKREEKTITQRATRPKEKEWSEENFRAAIQHWDFDCFKTNTLEAIDKAEAALYDLSNGSYEGWEEEER